MARFGNVAVRRAFFLNKLIENRVFRKNTNARQINKKRRQVQMNNSLQVFEFEDRKVRVIEKSGEVRFVAKDIVEGVGAVWKASDSTRHIPEDWKGVHSVWTPGGMQEMQTLSEQGVYFYLARSDMPAALPFQRKIAGEILPSIRKYGAYMTPQKIEEVLYNPDTLINLAQVLKKEQTKARELAAKIEEDRPKVLFADSVSASRTSILIGELAKLLRQNGVEIGQNRLFEKLREEGYLMKDGSSRNMPTQRAMELELFEVKETTINRSDGGIDIKKTPKVTGRGQVYFVNKFRGQAVA
jgi:anti-repressor protein